MTDTPALHDLIAWAEDSGYTEGPNGWYDEDGQGPYVLADAYHGAMEAASLCEAADAVGEHSGALLIAAERERQIIEEGWSEDHDDAHVHGEIAQAAICYAMSADPDGAGENAYDFWPWGRESWKPSDDPVRNLVKAGALIAAEIDRLQRTR